VTKQVGRSAGVGQQSQRTVRPGLAEAAGWGAADAASVGRDRLDGFRWYVHLLPRLGNSQANRQASAVMPIADLTIIPRADLARAGVNVVGQ
jgi:hypothetical protein